MFSPLGGLTSLTYYVHRANVRSIEARQTAVNWSSIRSGWNHSAKCSRFPRHNLCLFAARFISSFPDRCRSFRPDGGTFRVLPTFILRTGKNSPDENDFVYIDETFLFRSSPRGAPELAGSGGRSAFLPVQFRVDFSLPVVLRGAYRFSQLSKFSHSMSSWRSIWIANT